MVMFVYPAALRDLKSKLECESFSGAGSVVQGEQRGLGRTVGVRVCAEGEGKLRRRLRVLVRCLSSFCSTELTCCLLRLLGCSLFSPPCPAARTPTHCSALDPALRERS